MRQRLFGYEYRVVGGVSQPSAIERGALAVLEVGFGHVAGHIDDTLVIGAQIPFAAIILESHAGHCRIHLVGYLAGQIVGECALQGIAFFRLPGFGDGVEDKDALAEIAVPAFT